MPFRSRTFFGLAALVAVLVAPGISILAEIRTANRIIVPEGEVVVEDLYAIGGRASIEGTVDGDVFVVAGELTITGTVTGDVMGLVGRRARISGTVEGSVRLAALDLEVTGSVADDVAAVMLDGELTAEVGRDALLIAGRASVGGTVGRDVRAQAWSLALAADVGRDVLARTERLSLDGRVGDDVVYGSTMGADVAESFEVGGQLIRRRVFSPVWSKALNRAVAVLGLAGFIVAGLALWWVFRGTTAHAIDVVATRPGRSALVGLALVILPPLAAVPLFLTLVGIPVALLILLLWVAALFLGPVPAIAWAGSGLLRRRGGVAAGLAVGAVLWRGAMWLLPLLSLLLYGAALVVGVGAFASAGWARRRGGGADWRPLPP
ncbi:MAG TPA: polymer-forming cytoskeletal protein [Gemmatimonadales bacterium]|nr:polymer-forming cytoskeletal protein [Gemmatimonadales bacterium]